MANDEVYCETEDKVEQTLKSGETKLSFTFYLLDKEQRFQHDA